jgi:nucleotide-binding universal stress UspA family protein
MVARIAVGVDGTSTAAKAVDMAAEIARRFDAEVFLLTALDEDSAGTVGQEVDPVELKWSDNPSVRVQHAVKATHDRLARTGIKCSVLSDEGHPGEVLVRLAEECGADILVVGNKGMHHRLLGSVPNTVTHKAGCSVLVVKTT